MRLSSTLLASTLVCLGLQTASAEMRPITIKNDGPKTIYKLYGWPSDLVPRTFNLLSAPLGPGDSREVKVEDAYNSCVFQFQADFNNPRKPLRATRIKPKFIAMGFRDGVNLCNARVQPIVFN